MNRTKAKIAQPNVHIEALNTITRILAAFDAESQEKVAELRSFTEYLHDQILVIQKQMVDAWDAFSAERRQPGAAVPDKPTNMELTSPNVIYHLAQPQFASVFRGLVTFKVDVCEMRTEVDILAQFQQLETIEAYGLRLPLYTLQTDLPIVRALKHMKIKAVSVQWMAGRTFPNMEDCTITWPHYPETLALGGGVDLPVCTRFMYGDHIIDTLPNFRIPKLDTLIVRNEAWNKPRGSMQLAAVWNGTAGQVPPLKPRVLHLDTQCHDQHLINALSMLSELEELRLGVVRPDALGKGFFSALQAKRGNSSRSASGATHVATLCPVLKAFGIRYWRWNRDGEGDEVTPLLRVIIESRQKTDTPLQSFKFWPTKETPEEGATELCILDDILESFPNMEDCTIVWPHCPETLAPGGGVNLPVCMPFTYRGPHLPAAPQLRYPRVRHTHRPGQSVEQAERKHAARPPFTYRRPPHPSAPQPRYPRIRHAHCPGRSVE